jgi:hypothetical protein
MVAPIIRRLWYRSNQQSALAVSQTHCQALSGCNEA